MGPSPWRTTQFGWQNQQTKIWKSRLKLRSSRLNKFRSTSLTRHVQRLCWPLHIFTGRRGGCDVWRAMCSIYFIKEPNYTMVNDFGHTWAKMMAMALQGQSDNNIHLLHEETMVSGFKKKTMDPTPAKEIGELLQASIGSFKDYSWSFCRDVKD